MKYVNLRTASKGLSIVAGILCIGGLITFFRANKDTDKSLALNIIISSGVLAITNEITFRRYEDDANYQITPIIKDKESQITARDKDIKQLTDITHSQAKQLIESKNLADKQVIEINSRDTAIGLLKQQLEQVKADYIIKVAEIDKRLAEDNNRETELMRLFKTQLIEDVSNRIYKVYNSLKSSCDAKLALEGYESIHPQLEHFSESLRANYEYHCERLKDINNLDVDDWETALTRSIDIYSEISEELTNLKIKFRNTLIIDVRKSLEEAWNELDNSVSKNKAVDSLREYSQISKEKFEDLGAKINQHQNSLEEMRLQVSDLLDEIDAKNLEIADLKNQIVILKQPITWKLALGSNELTKGNLIIQYFWGKGLRLDRAFTIGDVYDSKIYFHTDNNPRTIVFKELNEHSESLQQLCLTQKPVSFEWDAEKGLMVASLVWKIKEKQQNDELSDEAVNRLARSWDTWKKHAKKWNRIRITGGSGAGKSPLTERIVSEQLRFKKVKGLEAIKLYNPQAGSRKDHWSFPSIGKTHQDSIRGIADLNQLCSRRYQGGFAIWIFDEVDSTLRQAPGKKRPTADEPEPEPTMSANMLSIITQIDHTSQAVFYLGQGANTGKIPNTTKGDWNNLVAIHINGNAQDYLRLAEHIDKDTNEKLMKQAETLQKYCQRKNDDLGLERTDPGAYRYALIDEYGEKQYYVLLPLFTADEFLDLLSTNTQNDTLPNIKSVEVVESESTVFNHEIACTHCQSKKFQRHSKVKDPTQYRYQCQNPECKKTFVAENIN
ncbi:hypothetical protein H6G64_35375 [Calothrix sp. FACHB-156]|nr:hypothetical protein [Calothrix sp. FACHB-156]